MSEQTLRCEKGDLPDDVRCGLVESLFADEQSMMLGSFVTVLSGLVIAVLTGQWAADVATVGLIVVTAMRFALFRQNRARSRLRGSGADIRRIEREYILGVCAYLFGIGALAFIAIVWSSDTFVLVLGLTVAIANTAAIALRNFAVEKGVGWQVAAVAVPLASAFLVRGGFFLLLIPMLVAPLSMFVQSSATRLRSTLLSEMSYRRRSESIAAQFDFAINNMSHGMCMISTGRLILVSNAKFAEFFGMPADAAVTHVDFTSLLSEAIERGAISHEHADRLLDLIMTANAEASQCDVQIEMAGGRLYDVTLRRHSNGSCVIVVQDVTEKREAERAIDHMARFDSVTNLRNRRAFEVALAETLAASRVGGGRTEVLFIDLDRFKQVNDTLGHKVGDKALVIAGDRLCALAGKDDFIARWGGDEFVILRTKLAGSTPIEAYAAKIIAELSRPSSIEGAEIVLGASIGIAVAIGGEPCADVILQQADMALYTAKREGRGRYRVYEDAMSRDAQERRLLELDLHVALAEQAFTLVYQPIVDLETRAVVCCEALARWIHPTRGPISPAAFVPALEELNLIHAFGAWSLQRACADAVRWPPHVRVSVNVSAKQLEADFLYDAVRRALDAAGLQANRLELEITETALLRDSQAAQNTLQRIHALGVRIALDDFGTGYSSLSHLMRFPLDKVKIDQSFTALSDKEEKAAILIENVARLSRQLGMVVTVEGVETTEQLERMKRLGPIAEGQGYLFSKPIPSAAVEKLLEGRSALHVA
ncbi:MAG TPA: EAL domain-containing protein [Roseiarcus sp.]|jgi:diguanylate cyclase (GGDEF)-like protein